MIFCVMFVMVVTSFQQMYWWKHKRLTGLSPALLGQWVATYCYSFFSNDVSDLIYLLFHFFFPEWKDNLV